MTDTSEGDSPKAPGKISAAWRTAQQLDSDAWKKLQDSAPLRTVRWAAAVALVGIRWYLSGTPSSVVAWLPIFVLVGLMLLPDADSLGFGAFTWRARQQADRAEAASKQAERVVLTFNVGAQAGEAAGESAQARDAPKPSADKVREFL